MLPTKHCYASASFRAWDQPELSWACLDRSRKKLNEKKNISIFYEMIIVVLPSQNAKAMTFIDRLFEGMSYYLLCMCVCVCSFN